MSVDELNPSTTLAEGGRVRCYAELARTGPVQRVPFPGFGDVWLVTGFDEVRRVLLDPRLVKSPNFTHLLASRLRPDLAPALYSHMLAADGAEHTRLRRLVGAAFTRGRIEALDLIAEFAYPLPIAVIFELLGVPEELRGPFHRALETVVAGPFVPEPEFAAALAEVVVLTRAVVADKRQAPADDLVSALIAVQDGGDRLSEDELTSMIYILILAGHETTANLIGNGLRVLLHTPAELAQRAGPGRHRGGGAARPNPIINGLEALPVRLGKATS